MKDKENELFSLDDILNMDFGPSVIDILLDEDNDENIVLYNEDGQAYEFEQVAIIPLNENIYAILKPATYLENISDDEAIVFRVKEFEGEYTLIVETDEEVAEAVFDEYYMLLDEAEDD